MKKPSGSGSSGGDGLGKDTPLKGPGAWHSLEIDTLRWRWQAAVRDSHILPPFEELALDGLGGLADNMALLQMDGARQFQILRAGKVFETWIDRPAHRLKVAELSIDRARALEDLLGNAMDESQPVQTAAYGVVNGSVCLYDLVALPLANRWGAPLFLVYLQERERKFSLFEAMFQATNEGLLALVVVRDSAGAPSDFQIAALNDGAARLLRGTADALRGRRLSEACAVFATREMLSRLFSVFIAGGNSRFEIDSPRASGGQTNLSVSVSAIGDLVAMTLTDVSSLKAREESFRLLFEGNPVPMFLCDTERLAFLAVNEAAIAHYGYDRDVFLALTLLDILPQEDKDNVQRAIRNKANSGGPNHLWQHMKADGTRIDVLTYWRATLFRDRHAQLIAIMDVTEKRQAERHIAYMAQHDALTGLPNRLLFHERLDEALLRLRRHDEMLAVHYLDLDQFKNVNDTLGHPTGDMLLKAVADRLQICLRETDIVARFGGDEFAVLQLGLSEPQEASTLADRIVKLVSEPYDIEGQRIVIGASAGIALAPNDGDSSDLLVRNADMALYRAKEDGRRIFRFFEPGMDARLRARRALELDLRNAFVTNEFEIYYQPLVTLETGVISGFEALLRWHSPARGMVPPAEFIPLAEEIGLIVPLGEWVLRQACVEAAAWPGDLKVAVNLSPIQFKNGNLPQIVFAALANAGLSAARLELEVTESLLLEESKVNLATLHELRALGASISMDDFGTGYSGMSYLRAFSFDKIKIDRSFVSELGESGDCMAIVRAIAKLGSSLGMRTTAEGVETERQLEVLRNAGCTEMQGFLLSRPIPASEIAKFLTTCKRGWAPDNHDLSAERRAAAEGPHSSDRVEAA
ncbi:MAG TPA: EAL domain-containing protein [Methylocella sp.]|nr:EAL domain-containing protein [Methylocella sp.]